MASTTTQQQQRDPPISQTTLLTISGSAFFGCLSISAWYILRKDAKKSAARAAEAPVSVWHPIQQIAPTTAQSEKRKARINARLFALKTLGLGTTLAMGTAGIMAVAVGWWLDVRNFRELSIKLSEIIPPKVPGLRAAILRQETPADERTTLREAKLDKLEDLNAIEFWKTLREEWDNEVKDRRAKFSEK